VWYRTPGLTTPQYADSVEQIDSGWLVFTDRRYIFIGQRKSMDCSLLKITAITPFKDGVGVARSSKQRQEFFTGSYHWPLIAALLSGLAKVAAGASARQSLKS
jgi:hypothetical protein